MADVTIPEFQGIRSAVPGTYDKNRRAGSGGQRYFTDMEYVTVPSFRGDRAMHDAQNYLLANPDVQAYYDTNEAALLEGGDERYETAEGFGKWHHDTIGKFENRPTDTGAGATLIDRTKAAHDATALEYQQQNLASPARQGLKSLERVTDSIIAKDIGEIKAYDATDREKINQTIGYMNKNAVSPYRLSEVTKTPLAGIQSAMHPFYQTTKEKEAQSSPNAGIQAALNNVVAESQSRPYQNFLRNIPVDGLYSMEEAGTVTDLLNKGHVTVQQIATYFNVPVEEVRQYYRAQGNRQGVGGASTITPDQLATFGTDINSATEGEVSSLVSLINSGVTTVEAVAARYNTTPAAVQAYLDSLVASTNGSIVTGTGLDDSNYGLSGGSGLSSTIVPGSRMSGGGLATLRGPGMYLGGSTDGMADNVPASIDNNQPARLSDGEFVVPADVVSHLGNGNSDSGAKQLYGMMDRVRQARTGRKEQGREINPNKFLA